MSDDSALAHWTDSPDALHLDAVEELCALDDARDLLLLVTAQLVRAVEGGELARMHRPARAQPTANNLASQLRLLTAQIYGTCI